MSALQTTLPERSGPVFSRMRRHPEHSRGVLVVDDDEMVRTFLGIHFREQGRSVWSASDGEEAIEIYQHHGSEIDVVLLDVRMPDMDGPQTHLRLRAINPSIACYFMSGDWYPYTEVELLEMGALGLVTKPLIGKLLAGVVDKCLVGAA